MNPLSDLLRIVRLDGAFFHAVEAAEPWSVEAVAARELSPRIMPAAEHLNSYHILTEGRCYGGLVGEEQVELVAGDVIVFPHGDAHGRRPRAAPSLLLPGVPLPPPPPRGRHRCRSCASSKPRRACSASLARWYR
jgi:hypothetical protein